MGRQRGRRACTVNLGANRMLREEDGRMGTQHNWAVIASMDDVDGSDVRSVNEWIGSQDEKYRSLFLSGTGLANRLTTCVMIPDGSKLGWEISEEVSELRDVFKQLLIDNHIYFVEVGYGELGISIEDRESRVWEER